MELIRDIIIHNVDFKFYSGIDFDIALNHPNDGLSGFLFFIVGNFISEIESHKRDRKIQSIIENVEFEDFEWSSINNNYIAIYQIEGETNINILIDKIINDSRNFSPLNQWVPIDGLKTGAWRIGGANVYN
jgi:hypothetical protein